MARHQRGLYRMACFNGLSADQQEFLVIEGYLPWAYEPAGECLSGAAVGIETIFCTTPGPRFYCFPCAIAYLQGLSE
jgi:hypothetical protein